MKKVILSAIASALMSEQTEALDLFDLNLLDFLRPAQRVIRIVTLTPCESRALNWADDLKADCAEDDDDCLADVEGLKEEALDVCDEEDLCLRRVKHSELRARAKCEDDDEACLMEVQAMYDEDTRICGLPLCE